MAMTIEQLEQTCREYEDLVKRLDAEKRELQAKVKEHENIAFALKSILSITDNR